MKPKFLFLFPEGWDEVAFATVAAYRDEFDVVCEGFNLFEFPQNANILWFDARRWIEKLKRKYRRAGLVGVASTSEQYGALLAASLAHEFGLPGTDPAAIVRAQHKYYARLALAKELPEATPEYCLLPYTFGRTMVDAAHPGLAYPFFVKPVKAAYSVLARRVESPSDLQEHLTFHPWESHIIKRLVRPFGDLMRLHTDFTIDPQHMMGEALLDGVQINVDGWMHRGNAGFLGIVDSIMYPGTTAFQRFEYPSRLPREAQARAYTVAERAMRALGFDHGLFNVELFWKPDDGTFKIIEVNPRLAAQFGDLYEKVDGTSPYQLLADLSVGREPCWTRGAGRYGAAASFVFREFNGVVKVAPEKAEVRWLNATYPDAYLETFIKHGNSRWRETKWLGSYRYAIVNLGGEDRDDLHRRFDDICRHLVFEHPGTPRFIPGVDALRPGR